MKTISLLRVLRWLISDTPGSISADGRYIQGFGISTPQVEVKKWSHIYNLQGQRTAIPSHGLNVVNGKEMLNR